MITLGSSFTKTGLAELGWGFNHRRWLAGLARCAWLSICLAASIPVLAVTPGATSERLIVVAPDAFHPALQDFLKHKQALGPAQLWSLQGILQQNPGADDPEKLKRFLYHEWREHGLSYVLLVGDVDVLPVRFMVLDRVTPAAFDYAFYPSDLYYSDLAQSDGTFDDWNASKEGFHAGYFGEVRGEKNKADPINYDAVDYRPDVAVGRWPVSTADEVRLVATKTIAFEASVLARRSSKPFKAAFVAVAGWVDSRSLLDRLATGFPPTWKVEKRYYPDRSLPAATLPPNHEQIRGLLNAGLDLLVHTGHGQPDAWEQCFAMRDLDFLTNTTRLPVIMSAGCSTAHFSTLPPYEAYVDIAGNEHIGTDRKETFAGPPLPPSPYQNGQFNPSCLGEWVLKRGRNGGVAYIGCNTGSQPCGLTLVEGFVTAWTSSDAPKLGDCWADAIRHYFDKEQLATLKPNADWYPPSIFFQGMKFMLFGDPSLTLPSAAKPGPEGH